MPKLIGYRGLLFDVDKTLTNSARHVSPKVAEALKDLAVQNYEIGTCTARNYASLQKHVLGLFPENSLHIVSGGSQIIKNSGEIVWQKLLDQKTIETVLQMATKLHLPFLVHAGNDVYANEQMIAAYTNKHPLSPVMKPVIEFKEHIAQLIVVDFISKEMLEFLQTLLNITIKHVVDFSGHHGVDITAKGVNKHTGLLEWCKLLNLQLGQVIGFGDSDNDAEYLEAVGFGVAMGNATPEIQSIADRVIGNTDEDGLAMYLEAILKGADL